MYILYDILNYIISLEFSALTQHNDLIVLFYLYSCFAELSPNWNLVTPTETYIRMFQSATFLMTVLLCFCTLKFKSDTSFDIDDIKHNK